MDKIKEEMAMVGRVASQVMELSGQLVEKFKDAALPTIESSSKAYWAGLLQNHNDLAEEELLDVLCFWCDFVDNTSFSNDTGAVTQLTEKFLEVFSTEGYAESDVMKHTIAYGLGAFAYVLPREAFQPYLARACSMIKGITMRDEAFSADNMEATENAMGALAKIAYKHMDGTNVTEADLAGVFGFMPFKSDECEAQTTHRVFLEQINDSASALHSAGVKPAAQEALAKIRAHVAEEAVDAEVKVLSYASKAAINQINF